MQKALTALATGIALAIGGAAFAQNAQQSQSAQQQRNQQQQQQRNQTGSTEQPESFQASPHGQRATRDMERMDTNRDQRLEQSEAATDPQLVAAWADIDVDRDGSVDATEYYLYAAQRTIAQLETQGGQQSGQSGSQQQSQRQQPSQSPQSGAGQQQQRQQ